MPDIIRWRCSTTRAKRWHATVPGEPGLADGAADEAAFRDPQGLAADEEAIYVAGHRQPRAPPDRPGDGGGVHLVRARGAGRRAGRRGAPLPDSPWPRRGTWRVAGTRLYFANAGTHQLGVLDLAEHTVAVLAGTGAEDIVDGPAGQAALAQPSGLALHPDKRLLAFADAETLLGAAARPGQTPGRDLGRHRPVRFRRYRRAVRDRRSAARTRPVLARCRYPGGGPTATTARSACSI